MLRPAILATLLAVAPLAAAAQSKDEGGITFDGTVVDSCIQGGGWRECIGVGADACMTATPGGDSTVGMTACTQAEAEWWDVQLNQAYQDVRERERQADRDWTPIPGLAARPSSADALRDAQRAWIAFRDSTCAYEELRWWGGTGASGAGAGCRLRLTAEQVLNLWSYAAEG